MASSRFDSFQLLSLELSLLHEQSSLDHNITIFFLKKNNEVHYNLQYLRLSKMKGLKISSVHQSVRNGCTYSVVRGRLGRVSVPDRRERHRCRLSPILSIDGPMGEVIKCSGFASVACWQMLVLRD